MDLGLLGHGISLAEVLSALALAVLVATPLALRHLRRGEGPAALDLAGRARERSSV